MATVEENHVVGEGVGVGGAVLLVCHNGMKTEQRRRDVSSRGNELNNALFGKERNSIFSPLYACPPQVTLAHKRN